jgi:thiol-disulfide isomerase/thioredoxin
MSMLVIVLAFVALSILVWKLWKPVVQPPKKEVPVNEARLTMFYTDWCGFSQKAMPEWAKLEKKLGGDGYFGTTHLNMVKVDADADKKTATLYGINAYPTVVLETREGSYDFDKRVTADNLMSFLRSHLGQEREGL